jgi:hypothetical protein
MKKYLLILTLFVTGISLVNAQGNQPGDEKGKQEKLRSLYVTQQLQLTPDEAQKFWPLHSQFENDIKAVNKEMPELQKQQAYLDVKKRYQDNFNRILGANRCERFFRMDGEFKRKLLEQYRQRNNQRPRVRRMQ